MYLEAFGLTAPSFSITPDPRYLYLSDHHQEALAHLLYGAEHDGFVLLTGEIGTGKTTVCRAFLQQLPPQVTVALILNPAVNASELLQAICRELQILIPEGTTSIQLLNNYLNDYLLVAHAQGRRPVLIIDEAQGLQPEVLEQVRLLTNLETTTHKLLQIFLIGQPELRDLLNKDGLRQVSQRITARFHLPPLNEDDTTAYIQHRLVVAGANRRIFTTSAIRYIHKVSSGIPRLINIICDRALLGAYASHREVVDRQTAHRACQELQLTPPHRQWLQIWHILAITLVITVALGLPWHMFWWWQLPAFAISWQDISDSTYISLLTTEEVANTTNEGGRGGVPHIPNIGVVTTMPTVTQASKVPPLQIPLVSPTSAVQSVTSAQLSQFFLSYPKAMATLLRIWGLMPSYYSTGGVGAGASPKSLTAAPCPQLNKDGLYCRDNNGGWQALRRYDSPAVLKLNATDNTTSYAVVAGLDATRVLLTAAEKYIWVPQTQLNRLWDGNLLIIWRPPEGHFFINRNSPAAAIRWLRTTVAQLKGDDALQSDLALFDAKLESAIRTLQSQYGIKPDGIVGPETLLCLIAAAKSPATPRLRHE